MLQPVGKLPPAIYWRRRLIFVVLPALLILLLVVYLLSSGGGPATPVAASTHSSTRASSTVPVQKTTTPPTTPTTTRPASTPAAVTPLCTPAGLRVQAMTGKASFTVGGQPDLYLVVTDISAKPCRQDLGDPQIVLTVTTGDVRVWGSHDCKIVPGAAVATLLPKVAVRRGIIWSGQTSAPGCLNRMVAQAGAYNLTATLAGQSSAPVGFVLTAAG